MPCKPRARRLRRFPSSEVSGKLLQILTEIVPGLSRVAVLWDIPLAPAQLKAIEDAASRLRLMILPIVWHGPGELPRALSIAVKEGARGLVVLSSPRIHDRYLPFVADAALKKRLPSISLNATFVRNGGLIAYGPVITDMRRTAAALVVKILRGCPACRTSDRTVGPLLADHQRYGQFKLPTPAPAMGPWSNNHL